MAKRSYSDEEKASALAALAANGGDVHRTSRQVGVPRKTLEDWSKGRGVCLAVADIRQGKKADLADRLEDLAHQLADAIPGKIPTADLKQLGVSLGIAVDKMRLLREQPTSIEAHDLSDDEKLARLRQLAERAQARSLGLPDPGGAPGMGQPQ